MNNPKNKNMFPDKKSPVVSFFSKSRRGKKSLRPVIVVLSLLIAVAIVIGCVLAYGQFKQHIEKPAGNGAAETSTPSGTTIDPETGQPVPATDQPATDTPATAEQKKSGTTGGSSGSTGGGSSGGDAGGSSGGGSTGGGGSGCSGGTHTAGGSDGGSGCWPGAANTGVPSGVVLSAYTGPTTITTPGTTITGKTINDDLFIQTSNVTIKNSRINGHVDVDGGGYSLTIEDSEIHASTTSAPALGYNDITVRRVEFTGGQHSILCSGNCIVEDSWLHDQWNKPNDAFHNNAFISNGGSNMTLTHNTLDCTPEDNGTGGGCTADASFFGDFAPITNIAVTNNLFAATPSGGYCGSFGYNPGKTYGSNPTNVDVTNNIFQRGSTNVCGVFGPATSYLAGNGNSWSNNRYTDGAVVNP